MKYIYLKVKINTMLINNCNAEIYFSFQTHGCDRVRRQGTEVKTIPMPLKIETNAIKLTNSQHSNG